MMENWQFFLQKEGDYAWLPLETPQVEILEGRYQLIAHTQDAGSSVRVKIRHQYEQENILQENIQDSVRQVDMTGKVEILPLVYLGLGSWFISCYPFADHAEQESDAMANATPSLDLQVLPQDFDLFEAWNFDATDQGSASPQDASFVPVDLDLADVSADAAVSDAATVPALAEPSTESDADLQETAPINNETPQADPDPLVLPTFSADTAMVEFRTVSSHELPRLVSDEIILETNGSPQLPIFSSANAILRTQQEQRSKALSKIRLIASVVSQQQHQRDVPRSARQEKFRSKLTQMAVKAEP